MSQTNQVLIWSPSLRLVQRSLGLAIATTISTAFSSRQWLRTPLPLGDSSDPQSALGILNNLGAGLVTVVGSAIDSNGVLDEQNILGCVVGGTLNDALIDAYGLGGYDAQAGDGLLAYIGIAPTMQGARGTLVHHNTLAVHDGHRGVANDNGCYSLASLLFDKWLALPAIEQCPSVFVRTRQSIAPVMHLATKHGFRRRGQIKIKFRGNHQNRIIFSRPQYPYPAPIAEPAATTTISATEPSV